MPYRPTLKTEAKKAAMRVRLLDAGRALFAGQGYEATTLQQIVRAAGTSIGNCYFYFPDKEALMEAVAQEVREEIASTVDTIIAGVEPGPFRLALGLAAAMRFLLTDPNIARLTLAVPSVRAVTAAFFTQRTEQRFTQNPPPAPAGSPQLAAHAWQGAIFFVAEAAMTGCVSDEPAAVIRFLVGWNMRAIGLAEAEITAILEQLEEYFKTGNIQWP